MQSKQLYERIPSSSFHEPAVAAASPSEAAIKAVSGFIMTAVASTHPLHQQVPLEGTPVHHLGAYLVE